MASKVIPIKKYQSNLKSIPRELSRPFQESDIKGREELHDLTLKQIDQDTNPPLSAVLFIEMGNLLAQDVSKNLAEKLEQAIVHYQQALQILKNQGERNVWATAMHNLANAFSARIRGDRAENIELAINLYQQVLNVRTRQGMPIDWANSMMGLANAYYKRTQGDRAENIERAIEKYELSLDVLLKKGLPADWVQPMMNLGIAYTRRIRGDKAENIEHAIALFKKALSVRTRNDMPIDWAKTIVNMADAYADRIQGDRAENLELAIEYLNQALEVLTHQDYPIYWALAMNNLANYYHRRIIGDRAENIDRAIEYYKQVLEIHTQQDMPIDWAKTMWNLANAYLDRIRGDRTENVERAIEYHEQAANVRTHENMPVDWARSKMSIASAYMDRIRGDRAENLERAIEYYNQALVVETRHGMPVQWARSIGNLANAYAQRINGDRAENLELAIEHYEQVLEIMTRTSMPVEWAQAIGNLANVYVERIQGDRAENLERAIEYYEQALTVRSRSSMPINWADTTVNLANTYLERIQGERSENIKRAIEHYQHALEVMTLQQLPDDYCTVQRALGNLFFDEKRWLEASNAYEKAIIAGELLYKEAITPEARQAELRKISSLPARQAYALAKTTGLERFEMLQKAVMTLEQSRSRWLNEALSLQSEKSPSIPQSEWHAFVKKREEVQTLIGKTRLTEPNLTKKDFLTISENLGVARQELNNTIAIIRQYDANFMPEPTFADVLSAISKIPKIKKMKGRWAITYLATTPVGTLAIVLTPHLTAAAMDTLKVYPVWCDLTEKVLNKLIIKKEDNTYTGYVPAQFGHASMEASLNEVLPLIGERLMGPIARTLRLLGVTGNVLIPSGLLGVLPLSAAFIEDSISAECHTFIDEFDVIYAPSALTLLHGCCELSDMDYDVHQDTLLAVGDPSHSSSHQLPLANIEINGISAYFSPNRQQLLRKDKATRRSILNDTQTATILHFACHGEFIFGKPLKSALLLAQNDRLTLADILNDLTLDSCRMVILSACQTAITDILTAPDDFFGLPAGFLSAGVPGVVGSLWKVKEISTALLMERFYYFYCVENRYPSTALRAAQLWLRDLTNEELIEFLQKRIEKTQGQSRMAYSLILKKFYSRATLGPKETPFASPVFWAAFTFNGI
jgi:CHAT domain-containing protein/tetratricopeptide (TPR) repeat protein